MSERRRMKATRLISVDALATVKSSPANFIGLAASRMLMDVEQSNLVPEWGTLNITGTWSENDDGFRWLELTLSMEASTTPGSDDAEVAEIILREPMVGLE